MNLTVGIIGVRVVHHHVAERSAVVDCDADAEAVVVRADHRLEVTGRLHPVGHGFLCDSVHPCSDQDREVGSEPMGIAAGCDSQTLFFVFMGCVQHGGAFLRRIHQGLIDRQLRDTIFSTNFIDTQDHLLPDFFDSWQLFRFPYRSNAGVWSIRFNLDTVLPIHIESDCCPMSRSFT